MDITAEDKEIRMIVRLVEDLFLVDAVYRQAPRLSVSLRFRFDKDQSLGMIRNRLDLAGYDFSLEERGDQLLLDIDTRRRLRIPMINIILFAATMVTVYFVPVFLRYLAEAPIDRAFDATLRALGQGAGIEFTVALISILLVHEMGHFIAGRRRGIIMSWPYFIPAPSFLGTFGAVIKAKSPFWNRRDLIEVGATGPIAGWLVALAWLAYGLSQSGYLPVTAVPPYAGFSLEGESILMRLMTLSIIGPAPAGYMYNLTEAAFAGWVGMLVTAINLLPIGQLDGGHILYGLGRRVQYVLGFIAMGALLLLGTQSPMWFVFAAFGLIFGVKHPPTLNDTWKPGREAIAMGIMAMIILVLSFTPIPFR